MADPQRLEHPFDVALAAPELEETEFPALQSDLLEAALTTSIYNRRSLVDSEFFNQECQSQPLSYMERLYQRNDRRGAIEFLFKRHNIDWATSEHHISNKDPRIVWSNRDHYIDMLVCVSRDIGLSILLPNERDHTFTFEFKFDCRHRQFSAKFAKLGFDAKSSFLWIGKSTSHDDVFVAWAPIASLTAEGDDVEVGLSTGKTQLSLKHYRITVMFFAFVMALLPESRGLWVSEEYPDLDDDNAFEEASNILQQHILLTEGNLRQLDRLIKRHYDKWISDAPQKYKEDSFILNRMPIIVTSQYGQNQVMLETPGDAASWRRKRDFSHVHYMSVAIATHFRARLTTGDWLIRNNRDIWNQNPEGLYTSPDKAYHQNQRLPTLDALRELELEDDDGREVPIYTVDGFRVKRRLGRFSENSSLGVLVNLATVNTLFTQNIADETNYRYGLPGPQKALVTVYPQAGLRSAGHFQALGLMNSFYPFIERLNVLLRHDGPDARFPIQGVACQGYNSVMHSTRGYGVQHHEAQQGLVSAALGGWFACDNVGREKSKKFTKICDRGLPHRIFDRKIANANIKRDLRLENVYVVDITALRENERTGNFIFEDILLPLTSIWGHSSVLDPIIEHTVLLQPQAYPAIYSWMTFPLTALIEANWETAGKLNKEQEEEKRLPTEVGLIELTACAERALNFMHTGNPAVIKTSTMNPLWIGRAIIHDGVPSINPNVVPKITTPVQILKVNFAEWPYDDTRNMPKSTSERAIRYRYNELTVGNFMAAFSLSVHLERPSPAVLSSLGPVYHRATSLIYTSLVALIADSQRLVSQAVTAACNIDLQSQDVQVQTAASDRLKLLEKWQKTKYPFSWGQPGETDAKTYQLLSSLFPDDDDRTNPLSRSKNNTTTYGQLAQLLIKMGTSFNNEGPMVIKAPLVKNGICPMSLRVTVPLTQKMLAREHETVWEKCLEHLKICFLPWSGSGPNARLTTHQNWIYPQKTPGSILNPGGVRAAAAQEKATAAANQDLSAPWKVPKVIGEMGVLWEKNVLPLEWDIKHASLSKQAEHKYVVDTYEWVRDHFDGAKTIHRLGIVIAIMVSRLLPNISYISRPELKSSIGEQKNPEELTKSIRELEWIKPSEKRKGLSAAPPFITMVSTAIIGFLDRDSPLRKYLASHDNVLGDAWADKHCAKYITPMNLVRLGIAKAKSNSIIFRARYEETWTVESPEELERLWKDIKDGLKDPRFGVYYGFRRVFGEKVAREVGNNGEFVVPPTNYQT